MDGSEILKVLFESCTSGDLYASIYEVIVEYVLSACYLRLEKNSKDVFVQTIPLWISDDTLCVIAPKMNLQKYPMTRANTVKLGCVFSYLNLKYVQMPQSSTSLCVLGGTNAHHVCPSSVVDVHREAVHVNCDSLCLPSIYYSVPISATKILLVVKDWSFPNPHTAERWSVLKYDISNPMLWTNWKEDWTSWKPQCFVNFDAPLRSAIAGNECFVVLATSNFSHLAVFSREAGECQEFWVPQLKPLENVYSPIGCFVSPTSSRLILVLCFKQEFHLFVLDVSAKTTLFYKCYSLPFPIVTNSNMAYCGWELPLHVDAAFPTATFGSRIK